MTGGTVFHATQRQYILSQYKYDYWMAMELLEKARTPEEKRAYAVLVGLINSKLKELEQ